MRCPQRSKEEAPEAPLIGHHIQPFTADELLVRSDKSHLVDQCGCGQENVADIVLRLSPIADCATNFLVGL